VQLVNVLLMDEGFVLRSHGESAWTPRRCDEGARNSVQ
jgi:hypothetical protein